MAILVGILWFVFHSALYGPSVGPQVAVALRKWKGLWHEVLFVGQGPSLEDLYAAMRDDVSYGYRLKGYFADAPKGGLPGGIPYLGRVSELTPGWTVIPAGSLPCTAACPRRGRMRSGS
ncbi:MAG: hypothetical protein LKE55_07495 [Prevotella sp.]|nr:hypothetical protein [Prevotella sp.]